MRAEGVDSWLFFDHHQRDPLAYSVLGLDPTIFASRRWYYLIPASGEPRKLVHKIESHNLDALEGTTTQYASWREQRTALDDLLKGCHRVAMQYSPRCAVPYVAMVDAGTIELIEECGVEIVTSANLIQLFEAVWTADQYAMHIEAGKRVDQARAAAFASVSGALHAGVRITEYEVQQFIRERFREAGLTTDHGPVVAVNANASNPHYEPTREQHSEIHAGDLVLIDLWAKLDQPKAVYYDVTWTGYCGSVLPADTVKVFDAVTGARDAAVEFVINSVAAGETIAGYQVDDACRNHLKHLSLAEHFFHRTGHSIGEEVHGTGANMDNFETHDERRIIPGTCFSVEPGVYLSHFGIRSEVNVYRGESKAEVTGEIQTDLIKLL
jgi:Xaa-Pro aminopeptidase